MRHRARPARRHLVSALACCTVLLAACGGDAEEAAPAVEAGDVIATTAPATGSQTTPTTTPPTGPATAPATADAATSATSAATSDVAAAAPDALRFAAPLVGGGQIDLAGYAGQPVLFWFWAPY